MKPLNRIAMFTMVLSLAFISLPAQQQAINKPPEQKVREVWLLLKSGPILNGNLIKMDPDSVDFTVKGIPQSVPCDDLIGVMFIPPPTQMPTPTEITTPILPIDLESIEPMTASLRPTILYREKAKYTEEARGKKIQGTVVLEVVFRVNGTITDFGVISGLPEGLNAQAIDAAKKIRFCPAIKDGKYVNVRGQVEFAFDLY